MLKCIYLCAREHRLDDIDGVDFWYNDIEDLPGIDYVCDALAVDLDCFDLLIATPPCNYWSKANNRFRETSRVAQATKHLLPELLAKFKATGKPFLIENVQNWNLMKHFAAEYPVVYWGNHSWFTNMLVPLPPCKPVPQHKAELSYGHRDNNVNVDIYIRNWVSYVKGVI